MYGVWVVDADLEPVADPSCPAGLRLDVGVLDERRLKLAFDHDRGGLQGGIDVAASDPAAHEHVVRVVLMQCRGVGRERRLDVDRRQRLPLDRQVLVRDGDDRVGLADEREDRLPDVAHDPVREHRLVLAGLVDPERRLARDVGGGQRAHDPGSGRGPRVQVADA